MYLHHLSGAFEAWDSVVIQQGGEVLPENDAELDRLIEAEPEGLDQAARLKVHYEAEAARFDEELRRLQHRRDVARNRAERIKAVIHGYLEKRGYDCFDTGLFKLRIQKNSLPTVTFTGPGEIPHPYRVTTVTLDKAAVSRDYKNGAELPDGVRVEYGTHLRIS